MACAVLSGQYIVSRLVQLLQSSSMIFFFFLVYGHTALNLPDLIWIFPYINQILTRLSLTRSNYAFWSQSVFICALFIAPMCLLGVLFLSIW